MLFDLGGKLVLVCAEPRLWGTRIGCCTAQIILLDRDLSKRDLAGVQRSEFQVSSFRFRGFEFRVSGFKIGAQLHYRRFFLVERLRWAGFWSCASSSATRLRRDSTSFGGCEPGLPGAAAPRKRFIMSTGERTADCTSLNLF